MKIYLDTNILGVLLFGAFSEEEQKRFPDVQKLFTAIDGGELETIVFFSLLPFFVPFVPFVPS